MPSTYTNNNGIELPATGEQSGTWGDTVNANMSIVDRLVTGVGTITLSGTTHTLTTTSGTLSDGMYRVLVFSGSPSGTNTVTISPNTQQKYYIVKNSSGQSVVLTQGSGGNVTVANGDVKIVYANGGGASAAVVDLTADLAMSSVNITGGTIDGSVIGGSSAAAGTFTTATVGAGLVGTPSLTTTGDTNTGIYFPAADTVAATTGGTERLRVNSSGNVGIGTSSPVDLLQVNRGSGSGITSGISLSTAAGGVGDGNYIKWTGAGTSEKIARIDGVQEGTDVGSIRFNTGNGADGFAERMRITSSGAVGIGTTSPSADFEVAGNMNVTGNSINFGGNDASNTILNLGGVPTGNKFALTDYVGDTTYTDFGLRVGRVNDGANGTSLLQHRGTGPMILDVFDAGYLVAKTSSVERVRVESTGRLKVSYASNGVVTALTDGATITPDFNAANNYSLTIGGARTLANPTNLTAGQSGAIVITQDGTGGRTLAFGTYWKFPGGTTPTLTTTASAVDVLVYYVESTTRITATMLNDVK